MSEVTNQRSYYAIIPGDVRYNKKLSPNAKLLYGEITALCNQEGYCWATNAYFAELYGVNKPTISLWVKSLEEEGFITIDPGKADGYRRKIYLKFKQNEPELEFPADTPSFEKSKEAIQENQNSSFEKSKEGILENRNSSFEKSKGINNTINTTSNNTSSSRRNSTDPPTKPELKNSGNAEGNSIFEIVERFYRHWFNKIDPHPIADVNAVGKLLIEHAELGIELLEKIANRAFERVVQEKQKRDWVTREVILRIRWGIEDHHKAAVKVEAKKKTEELNSIVVDTKATAEIFRNVIEEIKTKPAAEKNVDQDKLRRKSKFEQALREERGIHDSR